ncbi:MAG: BatD family protein [Planctomycetes bacterium]|nr:BatD family protein [Planctomycetota bacterium]
MFCELLMAATLGAQELTAIGPDPAQVQLGRAAIVKLSVGVARTDAALGPLPKIDGLEVAGGPPVETGTDPLTTTWTLRLSPRRPGVFHIPPFLVDAGGRTLKSEPMELSVTDDPTGAKYAFVEAWTPRGTYYVAEPIPVTVRFGIDAKFLAENVSQLFRRKLDVPAQLRAPWLEKMEGASVRAPSVSAARQSFVLNDHVAAVEIAGERIVDGRTFTVFQLMRTYATDRVGELVIPEPLLRFAYATRFREDFISGRVPSDHHEAFVGGDRVVLDVRPLPEIDRPTTFTGAVGIFTLRAQASVTELNAGETMQLVLRISGDGVPKTIRPPRLDPLPGFHVQGMIKSEDGDGLAFTYEIVPLNGSVVRVPPVPFTFFDPGPPAVYRTVRTAAIPLVVHGEPGEVPGMPAPEVSEAVAVPGVDDIYGLKTATSPDGDDGGITDALLLSVMVLPSALAGAVLIFLRARDRERRDPAGVRARRALSVFRAAAGRPGADLREALAGYVAARLRCPTPAVIAPGLGARLRAADIDGELADRAAEFLEGLVAEGYGSPLKSDGDVVTLVEDLEAGFSSGGRRG